MPLYEYQCQSCGHTVELLQKISAAAPPEACEKCNGANSMSKKISNSAFRLAGGGWYETDFKTSGKKNIEEKSTTKPS